MEDGTAAGATSRMKTSRLSLIMRTANTEERKPPNKRAKGKHEALSDLIAGQFYCRINCLNQFSLFWACFWLSNA